MRVKKTFFIKYKTIQESIRDLYIQLLNNEVESNNNLFNLVSKFEKFFQGSSHTLPLSGNKGCNSFCWLLSLISALFVALPNTVVADDIETNSLSISNVFGFQKNPLEINVKVPNSCGKDAICQESFKKLPLFIVDSNGYVGIGTNKPQHSLSIKDSPNWTSNGWGGAVALENGFAIGWQANAGGNRFGIGHTNGGLYFFHTKSDPGTVTNKADYDLVIDDSGKVILNSLEIKGGADIAEAFNVSKITTSNTPFTNVKPGLVVSIDPDNPGKLAVSNNAYDHRVAGIISGAGELKPGMMLGQSSTLADGAHPIALTGRAYCWADTTNGSIEPGDLLTTSSTPGHAMKVTDYAKAQGAVLGKAMTRLKDGKNLVLVLVTLQ